MDQSINLFVPQLHSMSVNTNKTHMFHEEHLKLQHIKSTIPPPTMKCLAA